jgi:hypothetical protein
LEEPPGRIERSSDREHYFAREHFGDVVRHEGGVEIPTARYFVEAKFEDGIIEMDFVLRREDVPGFEGIRRRSGQLRGQEEFQRVLDHFRAVHGEAGVKGIKGDWGGGDNLDRFNDAFHRALSGGSDWNEALRQAALETHTGTWAAQEGFSEIRFQRYSASSGGDRIVFDQVVVTFHKPGASGSGVGRGPGHPPLTKQGSSGPAPPGPSATPPSAGGPFPASAAPPRRRTYM